VGELIYFDIRKAILTYLSKASFCV